MPTGLAATARVITSAALIMICVFLSFVLVDEPTVKMMGLGLATAVFVDATIIRMVLVPATMELLGDANWWLPHWLDRLLPHLDLEGAPEPGRRAGRGAGAGRRRPAERPARRRRPRTSVTNETVVFRYDVCLVSRDAKSPAETLISSTSGAG